MFSRSSNLRLAKLLAVAMSAVGLFTSGSLAQFETRSNVQLEGIPASIAVGDFNNDGKQDMAVADCYFVWIYLGIGNGTFQRPIRNNVGFCPVSVAAADLDHDGTLDLVVADPQGGILNLMTGKGDGTFLISPFALANEPKFLGLADVNGDHEFDILVVSTNSNAVSIYLNLGKGVFARHALSALVTNAATAVGWGDFNGDGKLDLAVTEYQGFGNDVTILLGNGDGTFRNGATYTVFAIPLSVAVADFTGTGKLDIAVADNIGSGISFLRGNGDGTFKDPVFYKIDFPIWVAAADLNRDGKMDLAVAVNPHTGAGLNGVDVLLGRGDGTFGQCRHIWPGRSLIL